MNYEQSILDNTSKRIQQSNFISLRLFGKKIKFYSTLPVRAVYMKKVGGKEIESAKAIRQGNQSYL